VKPRPQSGNVAFSKLFKADKEEDFAGGVDPQLMCVTPDAVPLNQETAAEWMKKKADEAVQ
jgi:hypothetical protein